MTIQVGRYEIIRELARDGAGRLLLARHEERHVCLRVLDATAGASAAKRGAASAAARTVALTLMKLGHPALVPGLDCVEIEGSTALVVERLPGEPLTSFCRPASLLDIEEAVELVAQAAEALEAAARAGVVHGQLGPGNLLRVARSEVRITDFGVGPALIAAGIPANVLDHGAGYLPPERFRGGSATARGDQFSLGAVAFELLGGGPAFGGQEASSVVFRIVHESPPDPGRLPRPIPGGLRAPLLRALAKDPAERFDSGTAFAAALRSALADLGASEGLAPRSIDSAQDSRDFGGAPPAPTAGHRGRARARWPWVAGAAVLALCGAAWSLRARTPGSRGLSWEARVRVEPPQASLALDGRPIEPGELVRFGSKEPFAVITATLGCRSMERQLAPADAATEIVLELPPSRLDWPLEVGVREARIALNGRSVGQAPVDLALDLCRDNHIDVKAAGYQPAAIDIPAGATLPQARALLSSLTLERIPMGQLVLPEPRGLNLTWSVDGSRVGQSGREVELRQGRHKLRFKNPYHWIDGTLEVEVVAGATAHPTLPKMELASLTVQAFPSNAKVYLRRPGEDWRYLDETPATRRVAAGEYEIKVELVTTGQRALREVTLGPGENAPVRVSFGSR